MRGVAALVFLRILRGFLFECCGGAFKYLDCGEIAPFSKRAYMAAVAILKLQIRSLISSHLKSILKQLPAKLFLRYRHKFLTDAIWLARVLISVHGEGRIVSSADCMLVRVDK